MYHRIYVCAQSLQSCPAHWDPMDCNLPGSSVHGILQARILEWVTMHFSRGSSSSRDQIQVFCFSCTASGFFLPTGPSGKPIQDIFLLLMLFSRQVVSNSLWSHRLWHARFPCPSPSPRVCPSSCQLNQWCHPIISSSVTPLLLLPSIFPRFKVFSNELALCISLPKYWNFSFSNSLSNE